MPRSRIISATGVAIALLLTSVVLADDAFKVKPAKKYPARQKQGEVTVAVEALGTDDAVKEAFPDAKLLKFGFWPVLVVIDNDTDDTLNLEQMKARFITSDRDGIEPTPAEDLEYFQPHTRPRERPRYIPGVPGLNRPKVKKGPLAKPEIQTRAFKAPIIPPRSSASGFFYYEIGEDTDPIPGSTMYISGIRNLNTGRDLFYFEIPLEK